MNRPSPGRLTPLAFVAGATTVFLLTLLGFQQLEAARWEASVRQRLAASTERTRFVADYLSALRDVETGQRGYLVTNDRGFLQPFDQALPILPSLSGSISNANWGVGARRELADKLIEVGNARVQRAKENVELVDGGMRAQAQARVAEGTGKRLMDQARSLSARLARVEQSAGSAFLTQSLAERVNRQRRIFITELATLLSLSVLLLSMIRMVRDLRAASIVLQDFATRQAAVLEGATDGMMMLDERGHIENVNAAAEKLFGHPVSSMVGQSNLMLFKDPPPVEISQAYLQRLAAGHVNDSRQMFEGLRGDGSTIEVEVVTTPIHLVDGLHFLAIARDATERRQIERMKDEFVATVSHELRTPLTSVAGSLGLILGGATGETNDKMRRLVQIAYSNCNRLIRLINDMLDIEKIESGKSTLAIRPIQVCSAVEGAIASLAPYSDERQVAVVLASMPEELVVMADPDRLTQIVTNLVSNAVKFSPAGATVNVRAEQNNMLVRLSVSDQGPGIPDGFRSRIFQKFAQVDSTDSRQKGGTGLGLSIVKELTERMGGSVGFTSAVGAGSVFFVELPSANPSIASHSQAEKLGRMDESKLPQILHVDDDPDTLRLVASAFEGRAIVHSSPSVTEARATIERYNFDAVILDIAMPDGNGLDLIGLLNNGDERHVPVILYSALDAMSDQEPVVFARLTKSKATLAKLVRTAEEALTAGAMSGR